MNMMSGTSVAAHISLRHASMVAYIQDSYSEFHSPMVCIRRLLWSLPTIAPWVDFRTRYHDFMMPEVLGWDIPRFQLQEVWVTITTELLHREEFEQREITVEIVRYIFSLLFVLPPPAPRALK